MPLRGRTPVRTAPHPVHLCTHAQAADPCARTPRLTHRHTHAHTVSDTLGVTHSHPHGGSRRVTWPHCHSITAMLGARAHTCSHALTHTQLDSGPRQPHSSAPHHKMPTPRGARTTSELSDQRDPPHMLPGQDRPGGHTTSHLGLEDPSGPEKGVRVCRGLTVGPGPRREELPKVTVANFP